MVTQRFELRRPILYLFWISLLALAFVILPNYLGLLISKNQWSVMGLLGFCILVVTLYFSELRYLIFFTSLFLLLSSSRIPWIYSLFGTLRWVLLAAMAVVASSNWIMGRIPTRFRVVDLWIFGFLTLAFYSKTYSIMPQITLERSISAALFYLAVFWGVWNYARDVDRISIVIQQFLTAAALVFLLGFLLIGGSSRFSGFFGSPNTIGVLASILTPLALWAFLAERRRSALYLLVMIAASLVLGGSRAGILSVAASVFYFFFASYRSRRITIVVWTFFLTALLLVAVEIFGAGLMKDFFRWDTLTTGSGRFEAWREVMRLLSYRPLWGYGFGTEDHLFAAFDVVFYEHYGAFAHNSYIGLASQLGLIGVVLLFVPLTCFFTRRMMAVRRMEAGPSFQLQVALNASILGGLINAIFESWVVSAGNAYAFPFWSVVVLAFRLDELSRSQVQGAGIENPPAVLRPTSRLIIKA
jgi:hypothetical protein